MVSGLLGLAFERYRLGMVEGCFAYRTTSPVNVRTKIVARNGPTSRLLNLERPLCCYGAVT